LHGQQLFTEENLLRKIFDETSAAEDISFPSAGGLPAIVVCKCRTEKAKHQRQKTRNLLSRVHENSFQDAEIESYNNGSLRKKTGSPRRRRR
jgi:hypothetical protein